MDFSKILMRFFSVAFVVFLVGISFLSYKNYSKQVSDLFATSYVVERQISRPEFPKIFSSAKILFVGDMMFDRRIREITEKKGDDFIFSCIDDLLKNADLVVGNLEGPITGNKSVSKNTVVGSQNNYQFTFPTTTAELLFRHNIKAVSLGNNHIGNFGQKGIFSTRDLLDKAGVGHFGGLKDDEPIFHTEIGGMNFSFIAYNNFGGDSYDFVSEKIKSEVGVGYKVIVYAHWGDEYSKNIKYIQDIAKIFVKSGASAIVGAHPHVVLPNENIDGVPVYYSLGNFIFDQYWEESVRSGTALLLDFSENSVKEIIYPTEIFKDGRVCVKK